MKHFLKYLPTMSDVLAGLVVVMFGLLMITKGNIFIQSTPDAELALIRIPHDLPSWIAYCFVWYGFDLFVSGGRMTHFVVDDLVVERLFKPLVRFIMKRIRGERLKSGEEDV